MLRRLAARRIGLPLFSLGKGYQVEKLYALFCDSVNWPEERLQDHRNSMVRSLVSHAYRHVHFYRKRMDQLGLTPNDIQGLDDLSGLPPLTRTDLQQSGAYLISDDVDPARCYRGSSSGSTGEPVVYYHDRWGGSAGFAAMYFAWTQAGWRFGDRMLTIWGNPTIAAVEWKRLSSRIKGVFFNEIKYPAYRLTEKKRFEELRVLYEKHSIEVVQGYTNAIYLFAEYIHRSGKRVRRCSRVLTTAENLLPYQRAVIEEMLGPVCDFYGCGEIMGIAYQAPYSQSYQVIAPHVVVELGDPVGEEGGKELLVTDLYNRAFPFIRYKNGDAAVPEGPSASEPGTDTLMLSSILGRVSDIIRLPGGGSLTVPSFFGSRLLKELKGFSQYQIERTSPSHIKVHLAVDEQFDAEAVSQIKAGLRAYLPRELSWELLLCERIIPEKNGKFKLFVDRTVETGSS